jgi:hypothetical protein
VIAHVVEFVNFEQNCSCRHWLPDSLIDPERTCSGSCFLHAHVIAIGTATSRRRVGRSGLLQLRVPRLGFLEDVKWAIYPEK